MYINSRAEVAGLNEKNGIKTTKKLRDYHISGLDTGFDNVYPDWLKFFVYFRGIFVPSCNRFFFGREITDK